MERQPLGVEDFIKKCGNTGDMFERDEGSLQMERLERELKRDHLQRCVIQRIENCAVECPLMVNELVGCG